MGSVPPSGCRRSRFFFHEIKWLRRLFFAPFPPPSAVFRPRETDVSRVSRAAAPPVAGKFAEADKNSLTRG